MEGVCYVLKHHRLHTKKRQIGDADGHDEQNDAARMPP